MSTPTFRRGRPRLQGHNCEFDCARSRSCADNSPPPRGPASVRRQPRSPRVDGPTSPDVRVESRAGSFSYRKPPPPDELSGPPVDVSVDDDNCPGCGGVLEQEGVDVAYVTDIPAMPRPQVTEYRVRGVVAVRGRHPDVGPDQYGASAHRMGRRVMAAAHVLHYGVGPGGFPSC